VQTAQPIVDLIDALLWMRRKVKKAKLRARNAQKA
jgi:hypothetical protein